jgi:hypothetical protein
MDQTLRFSQLSPARRALVRIVQAVNFGEVRGVAVRDAEPVIESTTVVVIDSKLDKKELPRPELHLADFELREEVLRLLSRLDEVRDGTIQRIEVRAEIPRRAIFELRLPDASAPTTAAGAL